MTEMHELSKKSEWLKKVKSWEKSGKSAKSWCREHQVHYVIFLRWRKRFSKGNFSSKKRVNFIELKDLSQACTGIFLEYAGMQIHLSNDFDPNTLKKCLNVLRGGS